jgi:type II secretory pathway component PulM
MPEAIPVSPRRDDTAADMRSLEQLGRIGPQSVPALSADAAPAPDDAAEEAALADALTDAGVTATTEDRAAVQALAKLDPATVEAVTRWLKAKPAKPEGASGQKSRG